MMETLGVDGASLPIIWDADFLYGLRTASGQDTYVLCEINVSSVFAIPDRARPTAYPLGATSSTRSATTSQPRSLLSIARLNIARSRVRPSICNRVRIHHTCFGRSGGFWKMSLPLFQGSRRGVEDVVCDCVSMVILLGW
jgi:hypothetical protein